MVVGGFYRLRSHPESLLSAHYGGEKVNGLVPPLNAVGQSPTSYNKMFHAIFKQKEGK